MLQPFRSLFSLRWTNEPYFAPLPLGITRTFVTVSDNGKIISTTTGQSNDSAKKLELLVCQPQFSSDTTVRSKSLPILFLHGGFGSAAMYADFMTYLSTRYDAPTYALSLRGHGASYSLSYFRMVYLTGLDELATDLAAAVRYIIGNDEQSDGSNVDDNITGNTTKQNSNSLIILGHSSGGGLLQYSLAKGRIPSGIVSGIVLLDAIPNFGNISVYSNWARHDSWFSVRMSVVHLNHVASPLSSDALVLGAFFGTKFRESNSDGEEKIRSFRKLMTPYESLIWPLAMMKGWWDWWCGRGGNWLDVKDVLGRLRSYDSGSSDGEHRDNLGLTESREKVCVIVGSEDVLMDIPNQQRMAKQYRHGIEELLNEKRVDWDITTVASDSGQTHTKTTTAEAAQGVEVNVDRGVRFVVVKGAGHHVQNEVMWEKAAEEVLRFALLI